MRERRIITDRCEVVAIHLSHFNPREPELVRRLAAWGVRAGRDLDVFDVGVSEPLARRPRRILVTGGARSGKSREAERIVAADPANKVTYVATAPVMVNDPEWDERVERHRARRPQSWTTLETSDIAEVVASAQSDQSVLIDCLTLWLTAVIYRCDGWQSADRARAEVQAQVQSLTTALRATAASIVLVTNEVGSGIVPENAGARMFRDLLGEVNSRVSAECDDVRVVVAGRTISLSE
jgi:adenosylcobinamide kinase/adenosylcobinamide-phosphate guanylyltransferase